MALEAAPSPPHQHPPDGAAAGEEAQDDNDDTLLLAETGQQVLNHVDGTLAAVSSKIYDLLMSANIDLSEEDIRELLGQQVDDNRNQHGTDAAAAEEEEQEKQMLPRNDATRTVEGEEVKTADTSVASTEENIALASSDDTSNSAEEQRGDNEGINLAASNEANHMPTMPSTIWERDESGLSSSDSEDNQSVVTTATRKELKSRVGTLEGSLDEFRRQMAELTTRLGQAEQESKEKQTQEQRKREEALAKSKQEIAKLENELAQKQTDQQKWETKAQQMQQAMEHFKKVQQEKKQLEEKTRALQDKISALCDVLLEHKAEVAEKPVLAYAVATARNARESRRANNATRGANGNSIVDSSPEPAEKNVDNSSYKLEMKLLAIVLAVIIIASATGEYMEMIKNSQTSVVLESNAPSAAATHLPYAAKETISVKSPQEEDDEMPTIADLAEDMLDQMAAEAKLENDDASVQEEEYDDDQDGGEIINLDDEDDDDGEPVDAKRHVDEDDLVTGKRKHIVARLLRGLKSNTTKIWRKIKGIGDDIPSLVRNLE